MGLFGRRRAETSASALFSPAEAEHIETLWRLTALPRHEFDKTYQAMLERAWRWIAVGDGDAWADLKRDVLSNMIAALRARQARILPRFAAAEDASRLTEVMSFALAAAVLAERMALVLGRAAAPGWCPWTEDMPKSAAIAWPPASRSYGALLLPRLMGPEGGEWVSQERVAVRELSAYFGGERSELRDIATVAATRIGSEIEFSEGALPPPAEAPAEERLDAWTEIVESRLARDPEEQAGEAPADEPGPAPEVMLARQAVTPDAAEGGKPKAARAGGQEEARTSADGNGRRPGARPAIIGSSGAGWLWVNWLRRGYWEGRIPANRDGGLLYAVDGDAYVVIPDAFDVFASESPNRDARKVKNQVLRIKRHRVRGTASGTYMSTFRTELDDGRRTEGMLFPGELIWEDDCPPATGLKIFPRLKR